MAHDTGLGVWLARAADRWRERTALIHHNRSLDYKSLFHRAGALAASTRLAETGPFATVTSHAIRIAWATWLALHTGQPFLPLDARRKTHFELLRTCGIRRAFADHDIPLPKYVKRQDSRLLEAVPEDERLSPCPASPDAVQLLIATSGSTGAPRAAMLSTANLQAAVLASRERLGLEAGDVWLNCLPLFHIAGLSILLRCLEAGATVVLHDEFDARAVWKSLAQQQVTHLSLVPAMLDRLLTEAQEVHPPASLRVVLMGGGPLSAELFRAARSTGWPLCPTYGLSETASQVATLYPPEHDWQPGDTGKPLSGMQVNIPHAEGQPASGTGLIRISGPSVMVGYANEEWRLGQGLHEGGFVTGDLGHIDDRGHLHVKGRADDVLITGGENVHPREVEDTLRQCAGINDVAVVGRPDPTWGHVLVAFVVGDVEASEFSAWCDAHLPRPLTPREMIRVPRLPRNAMGKLDRRRLREWAKGDLEIFSP